MDARNYLYSALGRLKLTWHRHGEDKFWKDMTDQTIDSQKYFWTLVEDDETDKTEKFYLQAKEIHDFLSNPNFQRELLTPDVISDMIKRIEELLPEEKGKQPQPHDYYQEKAGII